MATATQVLAELGRLHIENLELRSALAELTAERDELVRRVEKRDEPSELPEPTE